MPSFRRPAALRSNAMLALFLLAVAIRGIGALFNLEANDPHIPVSEIIAYENRQPADDESWEAFQPRLYHSTVAVVLHLLPEDRGSLHTMAGQAVSCMAGILTLWLLLVFLEGLDVSARTRLLAFALVALNPKMVATSIQATNDAFVILFGTLALTSGWRYLRAHAWRDWLGMTAGVLLVCVSKGNGMAAALAVACAWLLSLLPRQAPRGRIVAGGLLAAVAFIAFVPWAGGYWARYERTGSPFYIPMDPSFPPRFLDETLARRPGITSVVDGFMTFRFVDLMRHPVVSNEADRYSDNRTSLWTFAYASANSHHYDNFPPGWQSDRPATRGLLRFIYVIALWPTAVLLWGLSRAAWQTATGLLRWQLDARWSADSLLSIAAYGSLAFLVLYAFQYRDFGCMKPIFVYPAIVALAACFARAMDSLDRVPWARRLTWPTGVALCAAYIAESVILLADLVMLRLHLV